MEFIKHVFPIFLRPAGVYPSRPVAPEYEDFDDWDEDLVVMVDSYCCYPYE